MEITTKYNRAKELCHVLDSLVVPAELQYLLDDHIAYLVIENSMSSYPCKLYFSNNEEEIVIQNEIISVPQNTKLFIEIGTTWGDQAIKKVMSDVFARALFYLLKSDIDENLQDVPYADFLEVYTK